MAFIKVARAADIPLNRSARYLVDEVDVAVWHVEAGFFAIKNSCPHQHFSRLHEGSVKGCELTCPMHGWTFDLRTGRPIVGEGTATMYPVRLEDGDVLADIPRVEL